MREEWVEIEGWPDYAVSNKGRVHNVSRDRPMKLTLDSKGYFRVGLSKNAKQKQFSVHRLVALTFVEGYFEGAVVNHIDGVKRNNVYTNLEWITNLENIQHAVDTGLIRKLRSWRSD